MCDSDLRRRQSDVVRSISRAFQQRLAPLVFLSIGLLSSSFVLLTDYSFVDKESHWHLEGEYRHVAPADVTSPPVKHTHLDYADGYAAAYYTHHCNARNALVGELGYYQMKVDWKHNPFFSGSEYRYGVASLAWVSTAMTEWRWVLAFSNSVDVNSFNWGKTGVYYGMMWGRYQFRPHMGVHVGWYGLAGVHSGYLLPILGLDICPTRHWQINLIFPIDASVTYHFDCHWSLLLAYTGFGRPYHMPHRVHGGIGPFNDGIFKLYASGGELDVRYRLNRHFFFLVGAGWNFGGWIQLKNSGGHHGSYYNFNGAPYGVFELGGSF